MFLIDLAGSYSSFDHSNQARKEPKFSDVSALQVKETISDRNNIMLERITSNFEPTKQETMNPGACLELEIRAVNLRK